jgi:hypothetical protein
MPTPTFNESILRKPETIGNQIKTLLSDEQYREFHEVAQVAKLCLSSSATNDYLEKIGAESIGFQHLDNKLGADGVLNGEYVEIKPFKKSPGTKDVAVVNDDTPMKLLKSYKDIQWLVLLCADKDGQRIQYAICAPFKYWENNRYSAICEKLKLTAETGWNWGSTLPSDHAERLKCLEELEKKHMKHTYVRSSSLSLEVLEMIPREEISFWKHPDLPVAKLHPILKKFMS